MQFPDVFSGLFLVNGTNTSLEGINKTFRTLHTVLLPMFKKVLFKLEPVQGKGLPGCLREWKVVNEMANEKGVKDL